MQISLCIESPSPQKKSDKGSFSDFFLREGGGGGGSVYRLKPAVSRLFWQLGTRFSGRCCCREVAVAERFKQESMYKLSAGAKKAAVVESWPLWRDGR